MAIYRTTPFKTNSAAGSPGLGDDIGDGYEVGSTWTNTTTGQIFICQANTLGVAIWELASDRMSELQAIFAAAADRITNSAAELAFANTKTIPANTLVAGDVIKIRGKLLVVARNAADTHILQLRLGTVAAGLSIATTGDLGFAAADYCIFEGAITVAAVGAGGTVHIDMLQKRMVGGVPTESRTVLFDQAMDTTIARDVTLSADASAANAGNQVDLRELEAWVERAGTVG